MIFITSLVARIVNVPLKLISTQETKNVCSTWALFKENKRRAHRIIPPSTHGDESGLDFLYPDDESGESFDMGDVPDTDEKSQRPGGAKDAIAPMGHLLLQQKDSDFSVHLDSNVENSCHWNCMIPVFVALIQADLLPENDDQVTDQAGQYFCAVRRVASGMQSSMAKSVRVSDPYIRAIHHCP